ncbi:MAG: septum formation inhibitor Maf [Desulfurivibrio sp.]|nr:septum formation inhibitor Maf [Desulfurivibrio sp.]MBU3937160.1 septum formation inhibitor Maf [Pseudomonadota bacterium]MBU4034201.1 septum formation inhibitor Maf [Pseudomonadota bacterium]MBU4118982.1 septum formation inhibitor Maf [Pseudomonadota bacterium]
MEAFRTQERLILASGSPRRRDFLAELGLVFEVLVTDIDETSQAGEQPVDFVARLAREKGQAVDQPDAWVLAADTVVVVDGDILGKPGDEDEACAMLMLLSGRWHEVWTGFSLCRQATGELCTKTVCTKVRFIPLTPELCRAYVRTGEPLDKAGAYGIQGKGCFLVPEISGSYTNVVGLPMAEVLDALLHHKVIALMNGL